MANTIRVYKSDGDWVAKRDGATRASGRFPTQKEAYLYARDIALNNGLTITIYYPNGGIKAVINPRNRDEESNCFLTSACVKYYGLKDDCYELRTLRKFRDKYLLKSTHGKRLVNQYYDIAPEIVKCLEADNRKNILFKHIFLQIKIACKAIENGEFEKASQIYKSTVANLYHTYKKG
jgi:hypothetical protein